MAQMTVDLTRKIRVPVASLAEASNACRNYIETNGWIPSSEWHGGAVRDSLGRKLATVSYNGRVWDLSGGELEVS